LLIINVLSCFIFHTPFAMCVFNSYRLNIILPLSNSSPPSPSLIFPLSLAHSLSHPPSHSSLIRSLFVPLSFSLFLSISPSISLPHSLFFSFSLSFSLPFSLSLSLCHSHYLSFPPLRLSLFISLSFPLLLESQFENPSKTLSRVLFTLENK